MQPVQLKLKQASTVLGTNPKDLQNLVQFGVVRPKRRDGVFLFDARILCTALIALHLKEAFGTKTELLSAYTAALSARIAEFLEAKPDFVVFSSRSPRNSLSVELRVPFRRIAEILEQRLRQVPLFRDLPRGRKRPGWKKEFLASLKEAAQDLGQVSKEEILKTIRQYRRERSRKPEIVVAAETEAAST